jgi:uncharacterized phosphosugar-binding protein
MSSSSSIQGIRQYLNAIQNLQTEIITTQADILDQVAGRMLETILSTSRIFVFGTGHSHMMSEEAFYRAGGLAAAVPIFMSDLMLHQNPDLGSRLERTPGLAPILLDLYQARAGEMLFVYSNSGANQLPVEIAIVAKERGLVVVGVCSVAYARVAPLSAIGKRLDEVVDYVIDNRGEPGDGLVELDGSDWRVGPSSTIAGALIWNSLVVEVIRRMHAAGETLPIYASFNMRGAEQHNFAILNEWGGVNPHLKGWIENDR